MKKMRWKEYLIFGLFLLMAATFVSAGDIIVKNGELNITQNLFVDTNTLYVDSTNNRVGIGTSSPSDLLDVNNLFLVKSTGNVGVGTILPDLVNGNSQTGTQLNVNDSDGAAIMTISGATHGLLYLIDTGAAANKKNWRWESDAGALSARRITDADSDGGVKFTIDSNDNVGIGTTSPSYPLQVNGEGSFTDGGTEFVGIDHTGTVGIIRSDYETGSYTPLTFWTNGAEKVRIDIAGSVGIGTANPNSTLHVVAGGTTLASSWDVYSDPNIKTNLIEQSIDNFDFSTAKLYSYNLKWSETDQVYDENGTLISENTIDKTSNRTQLGLASTEVPSECVRNAGDYDAVDTYCLLSLAYVKIAELESRLVLLEG